MFGWHVPAPNQAMLVSGAKGRGDTALPFKIVTGNGAFVPPIRSKVSYLTLAMQESSVIEECVTQQGISLNVKAVIAFKVGDDPGSIANAARRFLADQGQMSTLTGRIFAGHLRSIIGSMTVEDIIRERQRLAEAVLDASKIEMVKIGLTVDSLQIQSIDDLGSGYIEALAAPHRAAANREAHIAQARADQAAAEAQQESLRNQAEYSRQTAVKRAEYQAEIDRAVSTSAQSGPLAAAQAQQQVLVEQAKVAEREADVREQQLLAEVVRPAEADAQQIGLRAAAEANRMTLLAEAAASQHRIALDQAIIAQLPDVVRAAANGLAAANVTVLDGTEGLNGLVAGLASQGMAILQSVRNGTQPFHEPTAPDAGPD